MDSDDTWTSVRALRRFAGRRVNAARACRCSNGSSFGSRTGSGVGDRGLSQAKPRHTETFDESPRDLLPAGGPLPAIVLEIGPNRAASRAHATAAATVS